MPIRRVFSDWSQPALAAAARFLRSTYGQSAPHERRATILLCSHRLAAFPVADLVVVLDGGRIIEQGTHARLIELGQQTRSPGRG